MNKKNIWLANPNYQFGDNAFLPYAIARLWAYAIADPDVADNWNLGGWIVFRDPVENLLKAMDTAPPDILAVSCYIWNSDYLELLCNAVKAKYPDCVIIAGGPQIPDPNHFDGHHWADILINGEGEIIFRDILKNYARNFQKLAMPYHTGEKARIPDLGELISPYLSGVLDDLIELPYKWHALQETNRGCPYQCTFCDWGSATFSQVRQFPINTILAEIEWFASHEIELLYNCDANFGMLKRDREIAAALAESKANTGYPQKFRAAYAKKTTPQVYESALALAKSDMSKGVTLSVQSMDESVLKAVRRRPINESEFKRLVSEYRDQNVPTYTEIILGLPGESADTFKNGIARLLELGQHEGINIYPSILLQNSQMNDPEYRDGYGIKTRRCEMLLNHGSPAGDPIPEKYDLIVETKDMALSEWVNCMIFGWMVQGLHCMGFLRQWAIYMNQECDGGVYDYRYIYENAIYKSKILAVMKMRLRSILVDSINGYAAWNEIDPRYGPIVFPPEEKLFIWAVERSDEIYGQLEIPRSIINACRMDYIDPWEYSDLETWARECIWYSRKGKRKKAA